MLDTLTHNEDFIDAVTEVLNIGVGVAAAALSEMVQKPVLLKIPSVEFVARDQALLSLAQDSGIVATGVRQKFEGAYSGNAFLLFPENQSLELVRVLLGYEAVSSIVNLTEMEQEAITEVGNVVLNACLCSIADILHKSIESHIPEFVRGALPSILVSDRTIILFMRINFAIEQLAIQGYLSFVMDVDSIADFKRSIDQFAKLSVAL